MGLGAWEPFTGPAKHAMIRAQEVAQMFGSSTIGTEHIAFALAETDDPVGEALTKTIDREELTARLNAIAQAAERSKS